MKVSVFGIKTTEGQRYGLRNVRSEQVTRQGARWKTPSGAKRYAARMGWQVVESY